MRPGGNVGVIVLAAGSGSRFGSDKRAAAFGATTLLARTLATIAPAFTQKVLVMRAGDEEFARQFPDWKVVFAADAAQGMGHSLAAAMPHVQDWEGAIVALGDMPFVDPSTFFAVRASLSADTLVVPHHRGQRGNPVGIGSRFFAALAQLQGDQGARALFQRHAGEVIRLEVDDPGILRDVDTPAAMTGAGD